MALTLGASVRLNTSTITILVDIGATEPISDDGRISGFKDLMKSIGLLDKSWLGARGNYAALHPASCPPPSPT